MKPKKQTGLSKLTIEERVEFYRRLWTSIPWNFVATKPVENKIRTTVSKIKIEKRGTVEGDVQREGFKQRWGVSPDGLDE